MQGILGRGDSQLCLGLNNAADGSLRLADWVKMNEIKWFLSFPEAHGMGTGVAPEVGGHPETFLDPALIFLPGLWA